MDATTAEARIAALESALAARESALAAREADLAAERDRVTRLVAERDLLRASHERLRLELELMRRRIFVAKAERVDTAQLELEFAATLAALDRLGGLPPPPASDAGGDPLPPRKKCKPTGRRGPRTRPAGTAGRIRFATVANWAGSRPHSGDTAGRVGHRTGRRISSPEDCRTDSLSTA